MTLKCRVLGIGNKKVDFCEIAEIAEASSARLADLGYLRLQSLIIRIELSHFFLSNVRAVVSASSTLV
jgi:hypothetical protein